MDGRKVLILLSDKMGALSCIRFVAQVFRHKRTTVVIGFTNSRALEKEYRAIKDEIQSEFGALTNLKFIYRNQYVLNGAAVIQESQYCDLIVQPAQSNFTFQVPRNVNLSTAINLPIVIIPNGFESVSEILITHNGQFQQLQFIKLFFQTLGDLCQESRVTLIEFNHNTQHFSQNDEKLFVEYLKVHCPNLGIVKASGESPEKLLKMVNLRNGIVVSSSLERCELIDSKHGVLFREINFASTSTSLRAPSQ